MIEVMAPFRRLVEIPLPPTPLLQRCLRLMQGRRTGCTVRTKRLGLHWLVLSLLSWWGRCCDRRDRSGALSQCGSSNALERIDRAHRSSSLHRPDSSRSYWAVNGLQSRIVGDGLDFNQDRDCWKRYLFWAQHPETFGYLYSAAMYSRRGAGVSDIAASNLTCH
jgi:hypothetical protein